MSNEPLTLNQVRKNAKKKMKGICGVFGVCDGDPNRICQGNSYGKPLGFGGIGSGESFANNSVALKQLQLKMQLIGEHFIPDTSYNFFGHELSMPIMGGSVSGVNSFGGSTVITEEDFCEAVVKGCKLADTIGWRGDTYSYTLDCPYGLNAIEKSHGNGVKIVKPREQEVIKDYFKCAERSGAIAVGVDIDGCGSYMMAKHDCPVYHKNEEELRELVQSTTLPVIFKGIMTIDDALLAVKSNAAAIVVSNHGGRVLDNTPGTATVLPEIVKATKGKIKILVDGGIRTGYDVLKMLALGAEAVLIGRDIVRAAIGGGEVGVQLHMNYLQKTLQKAMLMTGVRKLDEITPALFN